MITNFCPSAMDAAMFVLAEGYVCIEAGGDLIACFERFDVSYHFSRSMVEADCEISVHFPNGQCLNGFDITDLDDFQMVGRRLDYNSVCEDIDDLPELVSTLIEDKAENLDVADPAKAAAIAARYFTKG
jgi:hypothetical protein